MREGLAEEAGTRSHTCNRQAARCSVLGERISRHTSSPCRCQPARAYPQVAVIRCWNGLRGEYLTRAVVGAVAVRGALWPEAWIHGSIRSWERASGGRWQRLVEDQ